MKLSSTTKLRGYAVSEFENRGPVPSRQSICREQLWGNAIRTTIGLIDFPLGPIYPHFSIYRCNAEKTNRTFLQILPWSRDNVELNKIGIRQGMKQLHLPMTPHFYHARCETITYIKRGWLWGKNESELMEFWWDKSVLLVYFLLWWALNKHLTVFAFSTISKYVSKYPKPRIR